MYESFYHLRERPFSLSPDPDYLYLSRIHREGLDALRYGIETRAGFMVVTGDIGAGKTTLLQSLLRRLDERTITARLVNTTLDPRELLEAIALDFGLDTTGKSKPVLLRDLGQFLCEQRAQGRRPLLIIDEAQNLTAAALEEVRLLSNFETEKSKLLQILIVGQPNLRDLIAAPELEQFRQRVAVSYHLTPLDSPETAAYIAFRLRHAAIGEPPIFSTDASAVVHRRSRGVPRMINVICDAALVFGYAEDRRHIDRALIEEAVAELEASGILSSVASSGPVPSPPLTPSAVPALTTSAVVPAETPIADHPVAWERGRFTLAAAEVSAQAASLAEREIRLAQREDELTERCKVLAEQYRAVRSMRAEASTTIPAAASDSGPGSYSGLRRKLAEARRRLMPKRSQPAVQDQ
jgi:putative secretion ATPase (PEP-CTERM system associated)